MQFSNILTALALAIATTEAVKVNPMPKPTKISWGDSGEKLVSGGLWLNGPDNQLVRDAFNRFQQSVRELKWTPYATEAPFPSFEPFPTGSVEKRASSPMLNSVKVTIEDSDSDLQMGVDESYSLEIAQDSQEVVINSKTVWGALHAFNTLQQIIITNGNGGFIVEQPVKIEDEPKFPHRGVMVDTARNFISVKAVKRTIDAMALSKLNVLHWHLTDTQSWPVEVESVPELTQGAYGPNKILHTQDLKDVIAYARARGVRIIPEIDMPGHSASGYDKLPNADKILACQNSFWSNDIWEEHTAVQPNPGQLDILSPDTYDVVEKIYNDLSGVFPDDVFHVGFDELQRNCYNYSEPTMKYLNDGHSYTDVAQYWINKTTPMFKKVKESRRLMMWEDVVTSVDFAAADVPKDVIMQSWNAVGNVKSLASQGYDVVISSSDWFYLDCGNGGYVTNDQRYNEMANPAEAGVFSFNFGGIGGSWCAPYKTWQRIYDFDMDYNLTESEFKHIVGGEAPLWSEQVDETNIDTKLWPRASALGELLWSGNKDEHGNKRTTELGQRIINFREYLVANNIMAAPLVPQYCAQHPHTCDMMRNQTAMNSYANNTPAA